MTHEPQTLAHRNAIDNATAELIGLRRLGWAMQMVIEDNLDPGLEAYEPLMGLVAAIRDKIEQSLTIRRNGNETEKYNSRRVRCVYSRHAGGCLHRLEGRGGV